MFGVRGSGFGKTTPNSELRTPNKPELINFLKNKAI